jgi:hypothetical protein
VLALPDAMNPGRKAAVERFLVDQAVRLFEMN